MSNLKKGEGLVCGRFGQKIYFPMNKIFILSIPLIQFKRKTCSILRIDIQRNEPEIYMQQLRRDTHWKYTRVPQQACITCLRGNAGESFSTYGGIVFLRFGDRWDVGHLFFIIFSIHLQKIYSAGKTAIVKLCFDHQTCDHSGLDFSNASTPFHTFHVYGD